jgi:gas vesicle protein
MNRVLSFAAGALCGAVVGAVVVLFTTPASGSQLRADAWARVELAKSEARRAMEETRRQKELEFEMMKQGISNGQQPPLV